MIPSARARFSWRRIAPLAFVAALALAAGAARAQLPPPPPPPPPPGQSNGQAPPPATGESSSKNTPDGIAPISPTSKSPGASGDAGPLPPFNPLEAEKDVEVGQYYLRIGKYDAAIDRFKDASRAVPSYALPWHLMGQAYEKKGDFKESINSFQKYLQLYPHSPERKKIEEHIADLQKKLEKQSEKRGK